ncbi:MAG: hypothetical protein KIT84_38820 [Labilithrix sp.]|nr:hypothetical protein [Labilithrix sp.]MCW5817015.1 hypothetical protein [Labilithrix sp.]
MRPSLVSRYFTALAFAVLLVVALASGCGRSSLELESLDGGTTSSTSSSSGVVPGGCNPSTCSNGCCDSNGVCQTGRNVRSCGSIGGACTDCLAAGFDTCTSARVCGRSDPACGPATCAGCCEIDGAGNRQCLSGTESTACGRGGASCRNCEDDGRACDLSTRSCGTTRCDATNCNGCCVGDLCLPGNSSLACGANGGQCGRCAAGQVCRVTSGGGGRCEGVSTCGPANCAGCCTATGQCRTGDGSAACGSFGQRCDQCDPNELCTPDGFSGARTCRPIETCGPANCAGCCFGNTCILATNEDFCGARGQQCQFCGPGQVCNTAGGFCEQPATCNAFTCFGCCIGDICAIGSQNTACGFNGQQCQNCTIQGPGLTCQSGSCQPPSCGPATCPFGCCLGNTCVSGTQDQACGGGPFFPIPDGGIGGGGQACRDCTLTGQTCAGQQCVTACGPANCNGCCNGGVCVSGIANNACGAGGVSCNNCTANGSFCNGLVVPRRCNSDQTTCPAPYGACPAGLMTDVTPEFQGVCNDAQLDAISAACADNPTGAICQTALLGVPSSCRSCVSRFNHPFARNTGLFACAASIPDAVGNFMPDSCRRSLGCSTDCASGSCQQCTTATQTQCFSLVNGVGGQCRTFANATTCANSRLATGQLCSQFSYSDYGAWLRSITEHFCGDGL